MVLTRSYCLKVSSLCLVKQNKACESLGGVPVNATDFNTLKHKKIHLQNIKNTSSEALLGRIFRCRKRLIILIRFFTRNFSNDALKSVNIISSITVNQFWRWLYSVVCQGQ